MTNECVTEDSNVSWLVMSLKEARLPNLGWWMQRVKDTSAQKEISSSVVNDSFFESVSREANLSVVICDVSRNIAEADVSWDR